MEAASLPAIHVPLSMMGHGNARRLPELWMVGLHRIRTGNS